ncbi:MAG: hypothetical protein M3Q07_00860 [Pseudobdellovibrionaceae bacterium]|nr:hypothetical protein [Pseudobdellovibrionaceae bacterium]
MARKMPSLDTENLSLATKKSHNFLWLFDLISPDFPAKFRHRITTIPVMIHPGIRSLDPAERSLLFLALPDPP